MSNILKKLEGMAETDCSALVLNNHLLASTFPKEETIYLRLSQQAFTHIFKQSDKADLENTTSQDTAPKYDEAHLHLGERRLICFRLEDNTLYISMVPQNQDVHKAQKVIRGALPVLRKVVSATSDSLPKV